MSSLPSPASVTARALGVLESHFSPAVPRAPKGNNIVAVKASGSIITDVDGREYIDLQTGIGVANTGHSHPKVVAAIAGQAGKGIHLQQNCVISPPVVDLLQALSGVFPPTHQRFFFNCSGTEAVESAIKLARHETGRQNVIAFKGGFHGRSLTALAITSSKNVYGPGYHPYPAGFYQSSFPLCLHCKCSKPSTGACCGAAMDDLRTMLKETVSAKDVAAVIIEPILGEGGYTLPPAGFMASLRRLCDEHGILLIADEVQSGVGRTGAMWAMEHEGVVPDITVFAKGIASGMPLSGIATRTEYMMKSPPSSMGGTYGANAVCAAAAVATLNVIAEEKLLENATARGAQLQAGLRRLAEKYPGHILDVRGRGCMVGLEFTHAPGSGFAGAVTAAAMRHGLLLLTAGWREIIRFIPPLVITEAQMSTALERLDASMADAIKTFKAPTK